MVAIISSSNVDFPKLQPQNGLLENMKGKPYCVNATIYLYLRADIEKEQYV